MVKVTCGFTEEALVPPVKFQPVAGVMLQEYDVGLFVDVFANVTVEPVEKLPQPVKLATGVTAGAAITRQALLVLVLLPLALVAVRATV